MINIANRVRKPAKLGDPVMRRTLAAIAAAMSAILGLSLGSPANAIEEKLSPPEVGDPISICKLFPGVCIYEVSTRGRGPEPPLNEFIELGNFSTRPVALDGFRLVANFGARTIKIAQIPSLTVLRPGQTYLLVSQRFSGPVVADQVFSTTQDIPDAVGIAVMNRQGQVLDAVGTTYNTQYRDGTPHPALTSADAAARLSLYRVRFTGNNSVDFIKAPATPGVFR